MTLRAVEQSIFRAFVHNFLLYKIASIPQINQQGRRNIMKVNSAVVTLVAVGVSTVRAENGFASVNMADVVERHGRSLEISEECLTSTQALYATPELEAANQAWAAELATLEGDCGSVGRNAGSCVIDSKTLASHTALVNACTAVGGTPGLYTDSFTCSVTDGTDSATATFEFVDVPECLPEGCVEEVGGEIVQGFLAATAEITETALSQTFDSVTCTAEDVAPTSLAVGVNPKAVLGVMSLAVSLLVVL